MSVSLWLFLRFLNALANSSPLLRTWKASPLLHSATCFFSTGYQQPNHCAGSYLSLTWPASHRGLPIICLHLMHDFVSALEHFTLQREPPDFTQWTGNSGQLICCLTCSLAFGARDKTQIFVSVHLRALNSHLIPECTLQCSCMPLQS